MKETKLRSWDKKNKEMYEVFFNISHYYMGWVVEHDGKIKEEDLIFMEYIGIKDIHREDVYAGDLLSINGGIYEVRFNDQYGCYMFYKHDFLRLPEDNKDIPITWHSKYTFDIIGNIYQNPELIP